MFCTKCGAELLEEARFCGRCGAGIDRRSQCMGRTVAEMMAFVTVGHSPELALEEGTPFSQGLSVGIARAVCLGYDDQQKER